MRPIARQLDHRKTMHLLDCQWLADCGLTQIWDRQVEVSDTE